MLTRFALLASLALGCSAAAADSGPHWSLADSAATPHFRIYVASPELQAQAEAAAELWARASDGAYSYEFVSQPRGALQVVLADSLPCDSAERAWGCLVGERVEVSSSAPEALRVSTLAHEFGHALGLGHGPDGLMNPHRSASERLNPCVSAELLASAGLEGEGACLAPDAG